MPIERLRAVRRTAPLLVLAMLIAACSDLPASPVDSELSRSPAGATAPDGTTPPDGAEDSDPPASEPSARSDDRRSVDARTDVVDRSSVTGDPATLPNVDDDAVSTIEDRRTVVLPAGVTRKGAKDFYDLPPRDEYWLDYTMTFERGFFFTLGGKLPGLAGGKSTTGCSDTDAAGWSARLGWASDGVGNLYIYDQHREGKCGNNNFFPELRFDSGGTHRVTQWLRVNTPGQRDGAVTVWVDGEEAISLDAVEFRGDVDRSEARIDRLAYAVFSGGKDPEKFGPPRDQAIEFGPMYLMTCAPDFSTPTPECAS